MATIQTSIVMADNVSSALMSMTNALNIALSAFQGVQETASRDIDVSGSVGAVREQINAATASVRLFESELSRMQPSTVSVNPSTETPAEWRTPQRIEVFNNTGVERFNSELTSALDLMNNLAGSQNVLAAQAASTQLLSPSAVSSVEEMNDRIAGLRERLQALSSVELNSDGAKQANAEIERLRYAFNQALQIQEQFSSAMDNFDISGANEAFNRLSSLIDGTERNFRDSLTRIREMDLQNAQWTTPQTIDIIVGSGIERYKQELQSANDMLSRLNDSQQQIGRQAGNMRLLPPSAVNDLNSMGSRIQALRNQIESVQNARIQLVGVERANSEMESLRQQLNQAVQSQQDLNTALNNMDVSAANAAYNRLNSIVDATERNIRDNVSEQQRFNAELNNGRDAASGLQGKIEGMAAAYLSIQGIKQTTGLSDTMAQTEARLNLIVDDGGSVDALQDKIFLSAQRAGADYLAVSQTISKLGLLAGNAFTSNDEIIAFTELMNKNFAIGNASLQEQASAMYQLTQAMASGKLQGDEYRSVIENAPLLAKAIEDYMLASGAEGTMKEWVSDGLLTADVIKNSLFSVADEINEQYALLSATFGKVMVEIKNNAIMAFKPVLTRLNEIANSPQIQVFADNVSGALVAVAEIVMRIFDLVGAVGGFVADNWSLIAPVVMAAATALGIYVTILGTYNAVQAISNGLKALAAFRESVHAARLAMTTVAQGAQTSATFAQTAAQYGLNAALLACPLTWIIIAIIAIIAIIYLVVAAVNKFAGASVSATGIIFGAFAALGAVIANIFMSVWNLLVDVFVSIYNLVATVANFLGNVFNDPIGAIMRLFVGLADFVLSILQALASAIDFIFGSNLAGGVQGWRDGMNGWVEDAFGKGEEIMAKMNADDLKFQSRIKYGNAWDAGYSAGENLEELFSNFDLASLLDGNIPNPDDYAYSYELSTMARDVANINSNTSDMISASEEDLKYLRDIAEREVINRYFSIEFGEGSITTHNNVNSEMDLDGVAEKIYDSLGDMMMERIDISAEGVYA